MPFSRKLWEQLGLKKTLTDIVAKKGSHLPYERALLAMTANRLCEPESKLGVWDRWLSRVYLPSCEGLKLGHMYEAMDLLQENAVKVEKNLFLQTTDLFNLKVDLIFYDTTTASFHVDYEDDDPSDENTNSIRKFGQGKEGAWAPQVVVALAVTPRLTQRGEKKRWRMSGLRVLRPKRPWPDTSDAVQDHKMVTPIVPAGKAEIYPKMHVLWHYLF